MKTFRHNIRLLRADKRWTQSKLASLTKLSQSTIAQIENAERDPSLSAIVRIAKAFKIEPWQLLKPIKLKSLTPEERGG